MTMVSKTSPRAAAVMAVAATLFAAGCSDRATDATPPAVTPAPAPVAAAPAPAPPAVAAAPAAPAPAPAPAAERQLPLSVQGVASAGLTVRVKGIELGPDATVLTVSASFASQLTNWTQMASGDTYLQDADGNKLMLKRVEDNRYLKIKNGDTMEGRLVFLGAVPPSATQVKLVLNEGSPQDDPNSPGLTIDLPLKPAGS
ncbi:MAG: hypothetical protein REJ24_22810 [Rhodocyclaceae bacterium]|nr:hypothetical protein [Pseudomonadota bacterium]MDQ7975427.1 hypothetical protein [Rhodocyclaceae bacterium]MDQ8020122.1 hypothetical protein [Pseudomonadota bacterium]